MAVYEIVIDVSPKILPFLRPGSSIEMVVPNPKERFGLVRIELKENITPEMMGAISPIGVALRFDIGEVKQAVIEPPAPQAIQVEQEFIQPEPAAPDRRPALPHVESEYEEVRDRIGSDLGVPVQTLFGTPSSVAQTALTRKLAQTEPVDRQGATRPQSIPQMPPMTQMVEPPRPRQVQPEQRQFQPQQVQPQALPQNDPMAVMQQQMAWMMQQMMNLAGGKQGPSDPPPQQRPQLPPSIMDWNELQQYLDGAGPAPQIDESQRLSREQARVLEKYRLGKSAYVVSIKSQVFVDDMGVSFKPNVATNLAGLQLAKVQRSNDLRAAFSRGLLKFVNAEEAQYMAENADITSVHDMGSQLPVFVGEKGVDQAALTPIDVTPGSGDGGSVRSASRSPEGFRMVGERFDSANVMVQDVNESDPDEQSGLMDLNNSAMYPVNTGVPDRFANEPPSAAAMASVRARQTQQVVSRTWKPATRLE